MWEQSDATTKSGPVNERFAKNILDTFIDPLMCHTFLRSLDFSYWQKLHALSGTMGIASSLPTAINL